ncbi:MAG: hypothetical protein CSA86_04820 [Arcobacter sp.]|nr:MAG: hypothetical protein CSA86_04820 [Arcobacter sp.]
MLKSIIVVVSILLFQGCVSKNKTLVTEPKWLLDPYIQNDKVAAVGCAKRHFKGIEAQKNLAISRAVDRIAIQNRVIVENATLRRKSISNGRRGTSSSSSSSLQTVDKVKVSTKIKDMYTKPDGEICVWVVQR